MKRTALRRKRFMRRFARVQRRRDEETATLVARRPEVLRRSGNACARCREGFTSANPAEVHHLVPRSRARGCWWIHDARNLVALCARCHRAVHERACAGWRAWLLTREQFEAMLTASEASAASDRDALAAPTPPGGIGSFPVPNGARVTRSAVSLSCQVQSNFAPTDAAQKSAES